MTAPAALRRLGITFAAARDAEYDRYRSSLPPVAVSPYNPPKTARWDDDRRRKVRAHMRRWSEQWWADRDYRMVVTDEATDAIRVEEKEGEEQSP